MLPVFFFSISIFDIFSTLQQPNPFTFAFIIQWLIVVWKWLTQVFSAEIWVIIGNLSVSPIRCILVPGG